MVASTSANILPSEKISMQRQNTSISDGNRKRGKNSEANCQSSMTTTNGSADEPLECVLLRSGQEPVVVNLDIPAADKPEEVFWVDNIHHAPEKGR